MRHGRSEERVEILRAIGKRGVGADRDALHALRAVLGDIERRFPTRHVLRRRVAAARRHDAERRQRSCGLVVAESRPEQRVERRDLRERRSLGLAFGVLVRTAPGPAPFFVSIAREDGQERTAAQRGPIRRGKLANDDLAHPLEPLRHHFHVRAHDALAEPAELLDVLLVDDLPELFLRDAELLEKRRHGEEGTQEGVALHAQLKVSAIGRFPRNLEAREREHADLFVEDLLSSPHRKTLPRLLAFLFGLPNEAASLGHTVEGVGVRKSLGVAAEHDGHMPQIAVHPNALGRGDHEVGCRRAFLLRSVLRDWR